jgi:hypothetical protein
MSPRRGRPPGGKTDPNRVQLPFKTAEVTRAIRGVLNMGLTVSRIDIEPRTGLISITPAAPTVSRAADEKAA